MKSQIPQKQITTLEEFAKKEYKSYA